MYHSRKSENKVSSAKVNDFHVGFLFLCRGLIHQTHLLFMRIASIYQIYRFLYDQKCGLDKSSPYKIKICI